MKNLIIFSLLIAIVATTGCTKETIECYKCNTNGTNGGGNTGGGGGTSDAPTADVMSYATNLYDGAIMAEMDGYQASSLGYANAPYLQDSQYLSKFNPDPNLSYEVPEGFTRTYYVGDTVWYYGYDAVYTYAGFIVVHSGLNTIVYINPDGDGAHKTGAALPKGATIAVRYKTKPEISAGFKNEMADRATKAKTKVNMIRQFVKTHKSE